MRNIFLTSVASIALSGVGFQSSAQASTQAAGTHTDHQDTIVVTAGQGGSFTIPVRSVTVDEVATRQDRPIEVTAGNGGILPTFTPSNEPAATPTNAVASVDGD